MCTLSPAARSGFSSIRTSTRFGMHLPQHSAISVHDVPTVSGIYFVLDPNQICGRRPLDVAGAAIEGGIHALQWRHKSLCVASTWSDLLAIRKLCKAASIPMIVNDRIDIAVAIDADGAHVGANDLPAAVARGLLPGRVLGISVESLDQLHTAHEVNADYVGVGPIFVTGSKPDATAPIGITGLTSLAAESSLPVVAIGGIDATNAEPLKRIGISGIAVMSAIGTADDVARAARTLDAAWRGASAL